MGETVAGETFASWETREFYGIYFRECHYFREWWFWKVITG